MALYKCNVLTQVDISSKRKPVCSIGMIPDRGLLVAATNSLSVTKRGAWRKLPMETQIHYSDLENLKVDHAHSIECEV